MKAQSEQKTNKIEADEKKYMKLKNELEAEKQKEKEPTALQAARDSKHQKEMTVMKASYDKQLRENKEEMRKLTDIAKQRVADVQKIYVRTQARRKK